MTHHCIHGGVFSMHVWRCCWMIGDHVIIVIVWKSVCHFLQVAFHGRDTFANQYEDNKPGTRSKCFSDDYQVWFLKQADMSSAVSQSHSFDSAQVESVITNRLDSSCLINSNFISNSSNKIPFRFLAISRWCYQMQKIWLYYLYFTCVQFQWYFAHINSFEVFFQ